MTPPAASSSPTAPVEARDHGGGLDAARARHGGERGEWLDLSTGINPLAYPVEGIPSAAWTELPDAGAQAELLTAARRFWQVPDRLAVLAVPGTSSAIAHMPRLADRLAPPSTDGAPRAVLIRQRTYNEHAAAFRQAGWQVLHAASAGTPPSAAVLVHPDNPTGDLWPDPLAAAGQDGLLVIDESFGECCPHASHVPLAGGRVVVLKGLGKFWGLAGLRLGFVIGEASLLTPLAEALGPWPVSGPALTLGARALSDAGWIATTRARVARDADRLDALMAPHLTPGASPRGTTLFRLYAVADAAALQDRLARARIWSRVFPYDPTWIRLGLPGRAEDWDRLTKALASAPGAAP